MALQRWGEPRETVDVDLTLLTGFGGEEPFIARLLRSFEARIPDAAEFAKTKRVIIRQSGKLEWSYIRRFLKPLAELKGSPEILDELEKRRREFESS